MNRKKLVILGSTGSIGLQTLDVAEQAGYEIVGLAAGHNVDTMEQQIRRYRPSVAALFDETAAADLRTRVADLPVKVLSGMQGLCELAAWPKADMALNAVVGMVGLQPTLAAIEAGHDVALANKETLVAGGEFVMRAVEQHGVKLLPVDSEHSAIFQCLQGMPPSRSIKRLILTASGGPFFGKTRAELEKMRPADALKHPNWDMGAKITIDSATMMNKGLELIEARWLFDVAPDDIDVVVHRESIIHSMVEYDDFSVLAQMGMPDMRIPIQYALTWPHRIPSPVKRLHLPDLAKLTFFEPDNEAFPNLPLCRQAITIGGLYPAAVNAANEVAVAAFLKEKIGFLRIGELAASVLDMPLAKARDVQDVLTVDREIRQRILQEIG